jgi:hypothetical protein
LAHVGDELAGMPHRHPHRLGRSRK